MIHIFISILIMELIQQLLGDTPPEKIEAYQSYVRTHLKLIMTNINKAKIQNTTNVSIRKNNCIMKCYHSGLRRM